jgi:hypothetical protein
VSRNLSSNSGQFKNPNQSKLRESEMNLGDLLQVRRLEEFPGWDKYRSIFYKNLRKPFNKRHYIFNIFGDEGTGKTHLIEKFREFSINKKNFVSVINRDQKDIPSVMGKINDDLKTFLKKGSLFDDRYSKYTELKDSLINSPNSPQYCSDLLGTNITSESDFRISSSTKLGEYFQVEKIDQDKESLIQLGKNQDRQRIIDQDTERFRRQQERRLHEKELLRKEQIEYQSNNAFEILSEDTEPDPLPPSLIERYISNLREYIDKELKHEEERKLVKNPVDELTVDFLQALKKLPSENSIILILDDYKILKTFLDKWLRDLIFAERYGEGIPDNTILVLSGSENLDREKWSPFESFMVDINLKINKATEVSKYLDYKNVFSQQNTDLIMAITGGVPFLLDALLKKIFRNPEDDFTLNDRYIVDAFLDNIKEENHKKMILKLSIPRFFDQQVFYLFTEFSLQDKNFIWLTKNPFLRSRIKNKSGEWMYDSLFREKILSFQREESKLEYENLHKLAISYYEEKLEEINDRTRDSPEKKAIYSDSYERCICEFYYHQACLLNKEMISAAVKEALNEFSDSSDVTIELERFSDSIVAALSQASTDSSVDSLSRLTEGLLLCLNAFEEKRFEDLSASLGSLIEFSDYLDEEARNLVDELCRNFQSKSNYEDIEVSDEDLQDLDLDIEDDLGPNPVDSIARLNLIELLSSLPKLDFDALLFSLQPRSGLVSEDAPQGTRAKQLLDWSESATGSGLIELSKILEEIIGRRRKNIY